MTSLDSFRCCKPLKVGSKTYAIYSLVAAEKNGLKGISRLPFSMKVLLENLLRNEDGRSVTKQDLQAFAQWLKTKTSDREVPFRPARVLMQDFTGIPAVVDLAAMRDAMKNLGGDPKKINPLVPVDLIIDHSVAVNHFGTAAAFKQNVEDEYKQNQERYEFLKWSQKSFDNFRVVPPGTGICHQVNLEYLSQTVWTRKEKVKIDGKVVTMDLAYPDTLVGTDSHTTMVNGLSVLGWGVGGIEAEAAMLGQPYSMLLPEVIGLKLTGKLKEGVTATDLVLTVTQMLRKRGVVGKFVEFFGPGLATMGITDRATLGNMSPEYGATCGFSPIDDETIAYLRDTGRSAERVALVAAYAKAQGMYRTKSTPDPIFTDILKLELSQVEPSLAGPKRPQDRVALKDAKSSFTMAMEKEFNKGSDGGGKDVFALHPSIATAPLDKNFAKAGPGGRRHPVEGRNHDLGHGDVVIAAITSCTNTSNPSVMIGAGLLARKAVAKGLTVKPWVKTSLAPGSRVTDAIDAAGGNAITCFFRDDKLSDRIGFEYAKWHADDAVPNFIGELERIAKSAPEGVRPLVSIILDGENAWEYYPFNGFYFLSQLYTALEHHHWIRTFTPSAWLQTNAAATIPALTQLCAGSWVYGTFSTWIGSAAKNRAWDLLCDAKTVYDAVYPQLDPATQARAQRLLGVCEGSDWFWWFGDYNPAQSVASFDALFRANLRSLYRVLGVSAPSALDDPISAGGGEQETGGVMRRSA